MGDRGIEQWMILFESRRNGTFRIGFPANLQPWQVLDNRSLRKNARGRRMPKNETWQFSDVRNITKSEMPKNWAPRMAKWSTTKIAGGAGLSFGNF
jgi:hypothetical protein